MDCSPPGSSVHGIFQARIFPRDSSWSGLPFPTPGDLPDPGIKAIILSSHVLAGGFFTTSATWKPLYLYMCVHIHKEIFSKELIHMIIGPGKSENGGAGWQAEKDSQELMLQSFSFN